jgi:pyruvate-ferredoxin/flavodoxin oxidoreductase
MKAFPGEADVLFKAAEENAKWRYKSYQRMAAMEFAAATAAVEPETKTE